MIIPVIFVSFAAVNNSLYIILVICTVTILYHDGRVYYRFYGDVLIKAACHSDLAAGDFDAESFVGGDPDSHISAFRYDLSSGDVHVALSLNTICFTLSRDAAVGYCDASSISIDTVALVAFSHRGNCAAVYCDSAGIDAHWLNAGCDSGGGIDRAAAERCVAGRYAAV